MRDYLFLQHRSLPTWWACAATTHQAQYRRLLAQARTYIDTRPPPEHPDDSITYIGAAVANLGLAYLLSEDPCFLDTVREWIRIAVQYPHWGKHRKPDHDLDAAWLLFGLGLAYDWLKEALPADERDALRAKLLRQGREMFRYICELDEVAWQHHFWQNHNWICFAGLATAGYALRYEFPETGGWCDAALENFKTVFALLPDDGSDYEGPVYWRYGVPWLLIADDLFAQQAGETLHRLSGFLENTFFFRLYLAGPNLVDTANLGDCHDRRSAHSKAMLYRFASLFRNPYAQWLADFFDETGEWERETREGLVKPGLGPEAFLEFLWYDPTVPPKPIHTLPRWRVFPDLGLLSVRSGWDRNATVLVYKCGQPSGHKAWHYGQALARTHEWHTISAGHAHPDENSFILIKGDDYLVVDEGYNRNCYSRYHSTILVDGHGQYREGGYNVFEGLGPEWGGRLETWLCTGAVAYARGNAARAYARDMALHRFTREVLFLEGDAIVLHDTLRAGRDHTYQWVLQTDVPPRPIAAHLFEVRVGNTTMRVHTCAPEQVEHHVWHQEVVANPTSAKPDWLLRHDQYALVLEPLAPAKEADFFVVLALNDTQVAPLACSAGKGVRIATANGMWWVGFGHEGSGVAVDEHLETDARWVAVREQAGELRAWYGGDMSTFWWRGRLLLVASPPVSAAMHLARGEVRWIIHAPHASWVSLWTPWGPARLEVNGEEEASFTYRHDLSLVRLNISPGETMLTAYTSQSEEAPTWNGKTQSSMHSILSATT